MAEFDYFGTKSEILAYLKAALAAGFTIYSHKAVSTPDFVICDSDAGVEAAVLRHEFIFVLTRPDITRYPFKFSSFKRDGVELWYFRTVVGGPCIEVSFHDVYARDGKRVVPGTYFAYHSKILHPETDEFEPAGDEIKKVFNAMIAPLRKKARKVKSIKRTAYVSPSVEGLLKTGYILAKPFDT
jgi:hypothetical protein